MFILSDVRDYMIYLSIPGKMEPVIHISFLLGIKHELV